ncbi:GtrA family protein [Thermospira aquatica]|uniref:GtrA family protein n=1 Tax=Thermospira aquatica TaxID=2828656 RepID=A0AAX3BFJ0_9SPIR|nr:GtrA family protein [Thermospira aquatica]URA10839.1 GtrA family protein [Thermospira aquatica]
MKKLLHTNHFAEMLRFGFVGVVNTLVDIGVFSLAIFLGIPRVFSQVAGYLAGTINSFFWNKHFTFRDKDHTDILKVMLFVGVNLVSLGASSWGIFLLPLMGMPLWLAKGCVTILSLAINFFGYRWLVFRKK